MLYMETLNSKRFFFIAVSIEREIRSSWQDAVNGLFCNKYHNRLTLRTTVKYVMLYFEDISIPTTATVSSAFVQFTAKKTYFSSNLVADVSIVMDPWSATTAGMSIFVVRNFLCTPLSPLLYVY